MRDPPAAPAWHALLRRQHLHLQPPRCRSVCCLRRRRPHPSQLQGCAPPFVAQQVVEQAQSVAADPCIANHGSVSEMQPAEGTNQHAAIAIYVIESTHRQQGASPNQPESHLTRCAAASQLPSRSTAARAGLSAARRAARTSAVAVLPARVTRHDSRLPFSVGVAAHGSTCSGENAPKLH